MTKSTERVLNYRERQALLKRFKREYYLTDSEHKETKARIKKLRLKRNEQV